MKLLSHYDGQYLKKNKKIKKNIKKKELIKTTNEEFLIKLVKAFHVFHHKISMYLM